MNTSTIYGAEISRAIQLLDQYFDGNLRTPVPFEFALQFAEVRSAYIAIREGYRNRRDEVNNLKKTAKAWEGLAIENLELFHSEAGRRHYVCRSRLQLLARMILK